MRPLHAITRRELILKELADAQRYGCRHAQAAFREKACRGWVTAMPAEGPPFEMVAFVHANHSLAQLVRAAANGQRRFALDPECTALVTPTGGHVDLCELGGVGLAIARISEDAIELLPADPRAARLVNAARHRVGRRGYRATAVIEAFLPCRNPECSRIIATASRRLYVAGLLAEHWAIDCEDLLDEKRWVRLVSRWFVPGAQPPKHKAVA